MTDMDAQHGNGTVSRARGDRHRQGRGASGTSLRLALLFALAPLLSSPPVALSAVDRPQKRATEQDGPLGSNAPKDGAAIHALRSRHLRLHTDLMPADGHAYLQRAEVTVRRIQRYWERPLQGTIECFLVNDLSKWTAHQLPHPQAALVLERVGGGIDEQPAEAGSRPAVRAIVYAMARPGILEHEIVHAYCLQTFGRGGPDWYKEGMAQLAYHPDPGRRGVQCPLAVVDYLRKTEIRDIASVVRGDAFTAPIAASFARIAKAGSTASPAGGAESPGIWRPDDETALCRAKQSYYWSWALCHLLSNSPNYQRRFQMLGCAILHGNDVDFDQAFGAVSDRLTFEYRFFIARCRRGYRVDLCRWDWHKPFAPLATGAEISVRILAACGYQASGVLVEHGKFYQHTTLGTWKTESAGDAVNSDGCTGGRGRLTGVVLSRHVFQHGVEDLARPGDHRARMGAESVPKDGFQRRVEAGQSPRSANGVATSRFESGSRYSLSDPFDLGSHGTWTVPANGKLYLRCQDAWCRLADNEGSVTVVVKPAGE